MKKIKAYKILNHDYTCRGFKYEIGKTYRLEDEKGNLLEPELCDRGFHACAKLEQCFQYYSAAGWNHFVEVELSGTIRGNKKDKYCSNIITIAREIELKDFSSNVSGAHAVRGASNVSGASNVYGASNVSGASYVSGAYGCMYVTECEAIKNCVFCCNIEAKKNYAFNKKSTPERIEQIKNDLAKFNYFPKFNNYFDLLKEKNEIAEKVPADLIESKSALEAYADMPQDMIYYIKSMPEYDEKIFNKITKGE